MKKYDTQPDGIFIAESVLKAIAMARIKLHRKLTVTVSEIGKKNIPPNLHN